MSSNEKLAALSAGEGSREPDGSCPEPALPNQPVPCPGGKHLIFLYETGTIVPHKGDGGLDCPYNRHVYPGAMLEMIRDIESRDVRLESARKLQDLTLSNEIRWMRKNDELLTLVASLRDWKSPDGVLQVKDLKWFKENVARTGPGAEPTPAPSAAKEICPKCKGTKGVSLVDSPSGENPEWFDCEKCGGSGSVEAPVEGSLSEWAQRNREWSRKTFGPGLRTMGVTRHIEKELIEIRSKPRDLSEWIDVVILALDGYWRHGGDPNDIMAHLQAKQDKNFAREWPEPTSEDEAVEHVRTEAPVEGK